MNIVILLGVLITLVTGVPVMIQLLKGHPKGLFILFFAEAWERFSYYGMRGLLIFYLTQHFLFDDKAASGQYGSYTTLVYLLPLIGGYLADRFLGTRKAVSFGALLLVAGHFLMAAEGPAATQTLVYDNARFAVQVPDGRPDAVSKIVLDGKAYAFGAAKGGGLEIRGLPADAKLPQVLPAGSYKLESKANQKFVDIFYLAISLIIMGVGFLKANISSIVGQLYPQGDPRRDPGFTLYYYGINLGSFWAGVMCGWLGQNVGWWAGFGLAGVGMLAGYIVFVLGKSWLEGKGEPPNPELLAKPVAGPVNREWLIYILGLAGVAAVWFIVQKQSLVAGLLIPASILVVAYALWFAIVKCDRVERDRLFLALILVAGSVVFWTLFEQAGSSLNLFAQRNTDLGVTHAASLYQVLGQTIAVGTKDQIAAIGFTPQHWWQWVDTGVTAAQTQSFNPGFILIFAPIFAGLWGFLGKLNKDPNPLLKFALALVQVGLGFLLLVFGAAYADASFKLPLVFLALAYLLHTTGEMCLSPVGLSQITKLSPAMIVSTMMAVWFLAVSWANKVGGWIAGLTGTETVGGEVLDPQASLHAALKVFNVIGWVAVACGVLFFILSPFLKKWAHGVNDPQQGGAGAAGGH